MTIETLEGSFLDEGSEETLSLGRFLGANFMYQGYSRLENQFK
jgi:hypothetical protein